MTEVGFCVVGLGMGHHRARMIAKTAGAKLVSVVDLNAERVAKVTQELGCQGHTSLADALREPAVEVVMVMTPSGLHAAIATEALAAGRHVITTKPMEVTLAKCDQMIAAAAKAGKLLAVDFEERYRDTGQKIKQAVANGLFGKMMLGEARLKWYRSQAYYDAGGWRGTWKMDGGGALANQSIHVIDLMRWVMGPPRRVIGQIATLNHTIETEDLGMALIEFESGARGAVVGTTTFPTSPVYRVEIHGNEGGVLAELGGEPQWHFIAGCEARQSLPQRINGFANVIEDMVSAVRQGTPLTCDGAGGRASIELLSAIYESARRGGTPVEMTELARV